VRVRQEKLVLALTVVLVGGLSYALFAGGARRARSSRAQEVEFRHFEPPPVEVALPRAPSAPSATSAAAPARELFSPPRDTRPLPPLAFREPPREPLPAVLPPSEPGPAPRSYGRLLRRALPPVDLPDLFVEAPPPEEAAGDEPPPEEPAETPEPEPLATPAAREKRLEGYRARYDWIQQRPGDFLFGRIQNPDRYGLVVGEGRASEPLLFVQIDPETGEEWFKKVGAPPIPFERAAIVDFGFAATPANEIEIRRARIGASLTRGSYEEVLELAGFALEHRLEAPRALEIAEDLLRRAAAYDAEAPDPRLLLARVYQAGFRYEDATRELEQLALDFPHRAEIHVELARLEERFLLFGEAERRLRQAVEIDRGSWQAALGLGGFLLRHEKPEEALEPLRAAVRSAPSDPRLLGARTEMRVLLGSALLATGDVVEAAKVFDQALAAEAQDQRARAGALACALLAPGASTADGTATGVDGGPAASETSAAEGEGFELLMTRGLAALLAGDHVRAKELYELAERADPLRSARPLAALAYLAWSTGNGAAASAFAEEALERDPADPYALYLRGRLLGLSDDYEGARAALLGALSIELEFEDALVALGEVAFRLGRFDDAERYLERAVALDGGRADMHALRGMNFLRLSSVPEARASFERALTLDAADPTARGGLAWCAYLDGDATEALILFRNLDDARRALPEEDSWRVWARAEIARIQDHVEKVEWRDDLNRKRLGNQWYPRESAGPVVGLENGALEIAGAFITNGSTQVYREYTAGDFVSFSADLWIDPDTNVRAGIFVSREQERRDGAVSEASVSRHQEGPLQVRIVQRGQPAAVTDMQQAFPTGRWVRLSIERSGDATDTAITITVDGVPLVEGVALSSLASATSKLHVGVFAEGEVGRKVSLRLDNASVVYRGAR
jgi:tetratricopeptide (TPR) repeat protein